MVIVQSEIAKKLTPEQAIFFEQLSLYIDKQVYFYGSITRSDYIPGKSDIDVTIFSENEHSTIHQICTLLNVKKHEFKRTIYRIGENVLYGFKLRYSNTEKHMDTEISVYNDKYKAVVIRDQQRSESLPFYLTFILYIVKVLFYDLHIIDKKVYKRVKQFLMSEKGEINFIEL